MVLNLSITRRSTVPLLFIFRLQKYLKGKRFSIYEKIVEEPFQINGMDVYKTVRILLYERCAKVISFIINRRNATFFNECQTMCFIIFFSNKSLKSSKSHKHYILLLHLKLLLYAFVVLSGLAKNLDPSASVNRSAIK